MAIETWMEHVGEERVRGVEVEERWEYIAGFMKVAQGLDVEPNEPKAQEAEKVLGLFAERLGKFFLMLEGEASSRKLKISPAFSVSDFEVVIRALCGECDM